MRPLSEDEKRILIGKGTDRRSEDPGPSPPEDTAGL
jgi:hypothetical protein